MGLGASKGNTLSQPCLFLVLSRLKNLARGALPFLNSRGKQTALSLVASNN